MNLSRPRPTHLPALAAAVLATLLLVATVASSATTPTWKLVDLHDRRCDQLGGGGSAGSYAVQLNGRWTRSVTVGMDNLPAGVTATPIQSPIAPGTSNGSQELAYVQVGVARRQATPGTYTMSMWADDGVTRQRVGVTLVIQTTRCTAY